MGYTSRVGTVPQLDPRKRAGIRQSFGPHTRFFSRRFTRYVLGPQARRPKGGDISIWGVPTLGGQPSPYLEGVAEYEWSHDGARLAYHTPGPGDPLFVSEGGRRTESRSIYSAPAGLHITFRRGRQTGHSFTSFRVRSLTNWTSGALRLPAERHIE